MSIASTTNRVDATGNGATSVYPYTFHIFSKTDLKVTKRDTSGVETILAVDTDYTVSGVGVEAGGSITLTAGNLPSGYTLTIRRVRPLKQDTDIRNQGDYYPEVIEDQFDKGVMVDQQQQDEIDRSLKLPETINPSSFSVKLPTDVRQAQRVLMTNASANGLAMGPTADDVSNAQSYAGNASSSATAAAGSASAASTSETNAASSASAASSSASAASTSATNASNSASAASTSATNAANSATSASGSASTATTQATNASNSASAASSSASAASTSASNASGSASAAATSATNAANSATAASTSASNAASSASAAAASASTLQPESTGINNLALLPTVASNALTIAVTDRTGATPSAGSAAAISFRSSTSATGTFVQRSIAAALSIVIPSGTTIGTANAKADYIYVYALDMVTAVELAVSLTKFDEGSIQSTTAISTGSSRSTLYSTTARTNVPVRLIGKIKSTQTTAGTWASAVSEISLTPFMAAKAPTVQPFTTGTSQTYTTPAGAVAIKVRMVGGGGGGGGVPAGNATNVSIAGGGGGGGYVEHLYSGSALLATFTYTVGGGGSFGTTTPTGGGAGGATTFGSLSANGGTGAAAGGNAGNTAVYFATGGQGGTASGGNIANATGSDGGHGISSAAVNQVFAGKGGASVLGGVSGNPLNIGAAGTTGYNYGGGGGGGATTISGGAVNGGAGAGGIIIVEEYYA